MVVSKLWNKFNIRRVNTGYERLWNFSYLSRLVKLQNCFMSGFIKIWINAEQRFTTCIFWIWSIYIISIGNTTCVFIYALDTLWQCIIISMIHTFYTYWSFQLALPMAIEDGKRMKWDALLFPLVVCIL